MTRVRELRNGDMVNLRELDRYGPGGRYPLDEKDRHVSEFELAVAQGDGDGPFTVESATTWVLHTSNGSYGVDPDWEITVEGHDASWD